MSLSRRRFMTISAGLALGAVTGSAHAKPTIWRGIALGAEAKLILTGLPKADTQRLIHLAVAEINRLESIFSIYQPNSALSQLNRDGNLNRPPADFLAVLSLATNIHRSTGGYFDPTIQPVWKAYAEHRGNPPIAMLEAAQKRVGMDKLRFDAGSMWFDQPNMAMTLNGIAQGFVTDRIVALLKSEGLKNAVVNMGEIATLGRNDQNEPWQIGLAEQGDLEAEEYISVSERCVATSAPRGTTFDGVASHIIDPMNGKAAQSSWRRISIVHKSAAVADGLSTAFVLMSENLQRTAVKQYKDIHLIAKSANGNTIRFSS